MKISKVKLPDSSFLQLDIQEYDYQDHYIVTVNETIGRINIECVGKSFFVDSPAWVEEALSLKEKLIASLGIRSLDQQHIRKRISQKLKEESDTKNDYLITISIMNDGELLLSQDRRFLKFRVSFLLENDVHSGEITHIIVRTIVCYQHLVGWLHFLVIGHFHRLILPEVVRKVIDRMENKEF